MGATTPAGEYTIYVDWALPQTNKVCHTGYVLSLANTAFLGINKNSTDGKKHIGILPIHDISRTPSLKRFQPINPSISPEIYHSVTPTP